MAGWFNGLLQKLFSSTPERPRRPGDSDAGANDTSWMFSSSSDSPPAERHASSDYAGDGSGFDGYNDGSSGGGGASGFFDGGDSGGGDSGGGDGGGGDGGGGGD
jgi:hypothetical protein